MNTPTRPLAVVTGASSGIGYELAKQFAQNGFDLLVTATGASINEAAHAFEQLGVQVETVQADLATYDGVETLHNQIKATGRPVEAIASPLMQVLASAVNLPDKLTSKTNSTSSTSTSSHLCIWQNG